MPDMPEYLPVWAWLLVSLALSGISAWVAARKARADEYSAEANDRAQFRGDLLADINQLRGTVTALQDQVRYLHTENMSLMDRLSAITHENGQLRIDVAQLKLRLGERLNGRDDGRHIANA